MFSTNSYSSVVCVRSSFLIAKKSRSSLIKFLDCYSNGIYPRSSFLIAIKFRSSFDQVWSSLIKFTRNLIAIKKLDLFFSSVDKGWPGRGVIIGENRPKRAWWGPRPAWGEGLGKVWAEGKEQAEARSECVRPGLTEVSRPWRSFNGHHSHQWLIIVCSYDKMLSLCG